MMFLRGIDKRIRIILVVMLMLLGFIIIRVGYIQVVEYEN